MNWTDLAPYVAYAVIVIIAWPVCLWIDKKLTPPLNDAPCDLSDCRKCGDLASIHGGSNDL